MAGMLYLVPTPIGNLGDISPRSRQILQEADFIAAEDTRVTWKLLNFLELKKPLVSYYEHNKTFRGEQILQRIQAGRPARWFPMPVLRPFPTLGRIWCASAPRRALWCRRFPGRAR